MTQVRTTVCTVLLAVLAVGVAPAQQNSQVRALLGKFKNWRYGMVSVFKVNEDDNSVSRLNMLLGPAEPVMPDDAKQCRYKDDIETYVLSGGEGVEEKEYQIWLRSPGCKAYERYYSQKVAWERAQFKKAFVVTTRRIPGEPFKVIGLLVQKTTESYYGLRQDLDPPSDIYLANDLNKDLDETILVSGVAKKGKDVLETSASTLYEYLENQIIQGNFENVTPEAQGIGEEGIRFVKKTFGNTKGFTEDDTPIFIRISEGLPQGYQNNNEVIVSLADGISYRRYERAPTADGAEMDSATAAAMPMNNTLPKYGVELRYGLEEINYPSLWSERLSLNALWGASRLGVILPTSGWAGLSADLGNTRKMTHAGMGINGAFDFPIRVISESGVFNLTASYVFNDAKQSDYMPFNSDRGRYEDYLVRFHASFQYSFAIAVDDDFMFRMRLGGTVYNMETWANQTKQVNGQDSVMYSKAGNETFGGISGRIDFMTTSWSTPVGFSLSYFDESVLGTAWLQVPIVTQFAVRFDTRIFAPVLRNPRPWEASAVVMPAVRFIVNF